MKCYIFLSLMLIMTQNSFVYSQKNKSCENGIASYQQSHEYAIRNIAQQHAHELLQFYPKKDGTGEFDRIFNKEILTDLSHEHALVYLKDKEPIGFVTYTQGQDWNHKLFNTIFKSEHPAKWGSINFLAIHKNHQGNGYGKTLAQKALSDLGYMGAHKVYLTTIKDPEGKLSPFYKRLGFHINRTSKFSDGSTRYIKHLRPNPWIWMLKKCITRR